MNFIAVDVETANPAASSICQIGIATYRNGNLHSNWSSLINPNSHFDSFNVSLHGINENAVRNSPTWSSLRPTVLDLMKDQIVVTHSPFDRTAILRASMGFEIGRAS